jgi:hypothetical protein
LTKTPLFYKILIGCFGGFLEHKVCTKCKRVKAFTEYNKHAKSISGLRSQCRDCDRKAKREYLLRVGRPSRKKVKKPTPVKVKPKKPKVSKETIKNKQLAKLYATRLKVIKKAWAKVQRRIEKNNDIASSLDDTYTYVYQDNDFIDIISELPNF